MSWPTLIMIIGTLIGGWALIGVLIDVSQSFDTVIGAEWLWVVMAFILAQVGLPGLRREGIGSVSGPLPLRAGGGRRGRQVVQRPGRRDRGGLRHPGALLPETGLRPVGGVSSGAIMATSSWIAKGVLLLVSLPFAWGAIHFEVTPESGGHSKLVWIILAVVVLAGLAVGLVLAVPRLRRLAADKARPKFRDIWSNLKRDRQFSAQAGAAAGRLICPGAVRGHGPVGFAARLRRSSQAARPDRGHHAGRHDRRRLAHAPAAWAWWKRG